MFFEIEPFEDNQTGVVLQFPTATGLTFVDDDKFLVLSFHEENDNTIEPDGNLFVEMRSVSTPENIIEHIELPLNANTNDLFWSELKYSASAHALLLFHHNEYDVFFLNTEWGVFSRKTHRYPFQTKPMHIVVDTDHIYMNGVPLDGDVNQVAVARTTIESEDFEILHIFEDFSSHFSVHAGYLVIPGTNSIIYNVESKEKYTYELQGEVKLSMKYFAVYRQETNNITFTVLENGNPTWVSFDIMSETWKKTSNDINVNFNIMVGASAYFSVFDEAFVIDMDLRTRIGDYDFVDHIIAMDKNKFVIKFEEGEDDPGGVHLVVFDQ
ncbi:hypothetical protein PCE1_001000 [Barthelona sp. PCE]